MLKIIIMGIVFIVNFGCANVFIPCETHVMQIKRYAHGDCVVKARKGQLLYERYGVKSRLCCGFVGVTGHFQAHCWNEVWCDEDQNWHLIDLSSKKNNDGWPRSQYYEYVTTTFWNGIPEVDDVRNDAMADWYSEKTVTENIKQLPRGKHERTY